MILRNIKKLICAKSWAICQYVSKKWLQKSTFKSEFTDATGRLGNLISYYARLYGYGKTYKVKTVISKDLKQRLRNLFGDLRIPTYKATCERPFNYTTKNAKQAHFRQVVYL